MKRPAPGPLEGARRLVVKIGSARLHGEPALFAALAADISHLADQGVETVLVSSGAVAFGRRRLALPGGTLSLEQKQAAAAAGQPELIAQWRAAFGDRRREIAQALLTPDVTESRRRWLNARATLETLLGLGVIPVVNENDTVSTDEIRFGDNDRLAARVAQLIGADRLILLSDVDGFYDADPRRNPHARLIAHIDGIDPGIRALAGGSGAGPGTGGMRTKLEAAMIAGQSGCATVIARGTAETPLRRLAAGAPHTWIEAELSRAGARRAWIAGALKPGGRIEIDAGAAKAVKAGKSLLPAGVSGVTGEFDRGDAVEIALPGEPAFARGVSAYNAEEARAIAGLRSDAIEERLGYRRGAALIHAQDTLLLRADDGDPSHA